MKLKELCKYCEWLNQGHCMMGNDRWRSLMAEREVDCEDFEPRNLCERCSKKCKNPVPDARVVDCEKFEPKRRKRC